MIYFLDKDPKKCAEMYSAKHLNVTISKLEYIIMITLLNKILFLKKNFIVPFKFHTLSREAKRYLNRNRGFLKNPNVVRSDGGHLYETFMSVEDLNSFGTELYIYSSDILGPKISSYILEFSDYIMKAFANVYEEDPIIKDYVVPLLGNGEYTALDSYYWALTKFVGNINFRSLLYRYHTRSILCEIMYKQDCCNIESPSPCRSFYLLYWLICFMKELNFQRKLRLNTSQDHISYIRIMDVLNKVEEYSSLFVIKTSSKVTLDSANTAVRAMSIQDKRNIVESLLVTGASKHIDLEGLTYTTLRALGANTFLYSEDGSEVKYIPNDLFLDATLCSLEYLSALGSVLRGKEYTSENIDIKHYDITSPILRAADVHGVDLRKIFVCDRDNVDYFIANSAFCADKSLALAKTDCEYILLYANLSYRREMAKTIKKDERGAIIVANFPLGHTRPMPVPILSSEAIIRNHIKEYSKIK